MSSVTVRYFAAAIDAAGREEEQIEGITTAGDLRLVLAARYGARMERILEIGSLLVDGVVTRNPDRAVVARVDVLPPFAGG